jgi:hypothetical protein
MPRAGLESAITATKRPQTYALDRAATGIWFGVLTAVKIWIVVIWVVTPVVLWRLTSVSED